MNIYQGLVRKFLFALDSEFVHDSINFAGDVSEYLPSAIKETLLPPLVVPPALSISTLGQTFAHPVGLAGGFDKNALHYPFLQRFGFSFIELGTVTRHPQVGNPRPRIFRDPAQFALYNSSGFPNCGAEKFLNHRLSCGKKIPLGLSLGKMKASTPEEALTEYREMAQILTPHFDYTVINVSSPNTPGLRLLQAAGIIEELIDQISKIRTEMKNSSEKPVGPWLVKVSPNLDDDTLSVIAKAILECQIDGIIATNTFPQTDKIFSSFKGPVTLSACGLSGLPLRQLSTRVVAKLYRLTEGKVPIIGVGGIFTADDVWEKLEAGASLTQVYTGFVYEGPRMLHHIAENLKKRCEKEGISSIQQIVGRRAEELSSNL